MVFSTFILDSVINMEAKYCVQTQHQTFTNRKTVLVQFSFSTNDTISPAQNMHCKKKLIVLCVNVFAYFDAL